jgi:20S proteasome subunit alpha 6
MKTQCLNHRFNFDRSLKVSSIVDEIGEKAQYNTQHYGKRPYGVGILVAGADETGPHLFNFQPSGLTEEYVAFAIGARSQMARTYLERHIDEFANCDKEQLISHGMRALKESLVQDRELTVDNTSVGIVGVTGKKVSEPFRVFDGQAVKGWIDAVNESQGGEVAGEGAGNGEQMEVDA